MAFGRESGIFGDRGFDIFMIHRPTLECSNWWEFIFEWGQKSSFGKTSEIPIVMSLEMASGIHLDCLQWWIWEGLYIYFRKSSEMPLV